MAALPILPIIDQYGKGLSTTPQYAMSRLSIEDRMDSDDYIHSNLTGVWELDAIIASYLSIEAIWRLTTNPIAPDILATDEESSRKEHVLQDSASQNGLVVLADLLGAGDNPIHNHRIFLTIHTLVTRLLGIPFEPWRRSRQSNVLWDTQPPPTSEYDTLMDDLATYAPLLFPPSVRITDALQDLASLVHSNRLFRMHISKISNLALLLGLDLPTTFYQLVVDTIVRNGLDIEAIPEAFAWEHQLDGPPPWNPTEDPTLDDRPYLASLDWIFYEVVSHRADKLTKYQLPVTQGRGYYRALEVMAGNKELMGHLWYSLVEEVVSVYDGAPHLLSDEARGALLMLVLEAWPQIEEVADNLEGTGYNETVMDNEFLYEELVSYGYSRTLDLMLTLAKLPIRSVYDGSIGPSSPSVASVFYYGERFLNQIRDRFPEVYNVLKKHNVVGEQTDL